MEITVHRKLQFLFFSIILLSISFISGCPAGNGESASKTAPVITSPVSATFTLGEAGSFTVTATGNPAPTFSISGTLPSGVTFNNSTGVLSGTPASRSAGTYPLTITAGNGVSPDATQNFTLTVSFGAFNTSFLPYAVPGSTYNGFGGCTLDPDGNLLYVVNMIHQVRSLNRITGLETTIANSIPGVALLSITYNNGSIYVGDDSGNIYKVNPSTGTSTLLATVTGGIQGLAIAPSGFGSYGGQLIAITLFAIDPEDDPIKYSGYLYAIDQSQSSPVPVQIKDLKIMPTAMVFGSDGTLYVADYTNNKIITVSSTGVKTDFATGFSGPDGLTIDNSGGFLYVADSTSYSLYRVTIPGGIVSTVATSINFDHNFWPTPIVYDPVSNIVIFGITAGTGMTISYQAL
jgi:sugar lactone lactonase YvrE